MPASHMPATQMPAIRMSVRWVGWLVSAVLLALAFVPPSFADTAPAPVVFRWANDRDLASLDPHSRNETFQLSFDLNLYEPLVGRDGAMRLEPRLATGWAQTEPDTWRFRLRQNVTFHDGSPFTADDVLASYERARRPGSDFSGDFATVKSLRKIDDYTIEFVTTNPDPILPAEITDWAIMSKAWLAKLGNPAPSLTGAVAESENGTGPFQLKSRKPGETTVLVPAAHWWGKVAHNLDEVEFSVIPDAKARVEALEAGKLDLVYDPPVDAFSRIRDGRGLRLVEAPEWRVIMLGMNQSGDGFHGVGAGAVKGNPFKDKRVRQSVALAVDEQALKSEILQGFAAPAALIVAKGVTGYSAELDKRPGYDPAAAKRLLAEAGYPNGFPVTFDCPDGKYVADAELCRQITAMLQAVGIDATLRLQPPGPYFSQIGPPQYATDLYMIGWLPASGDARDALVNLAAARNAEAGRGVFNVGGYADPAVDTLIDKIQVEPDVTIRNDLIGQALTLVRDDAAYVPLHQQMIVWAARQGVSIAARPDDYLQFEDVRVQKVPSPLTMP